MVYRAYVSTYGCRRKDVKLDEECSEEAWVFPEGLEVGRVAQYHKKISRVWNWEEDSSDEEAQWKKMSGDEDWRHHGLESEAGEKIHELLAEGVVTSVDMDVGKRTEESDYEFEANDDEESNYEFEANDDEEGRMAASEDESRRVTTVTFTWHGAVESQDEGTTWRFVDTPMSSRLKMAKGGFHDPSGRTTVSFSKGENPEHVIKAPDDAWALLHQRMYVLTLVGSEPAGDGRLSLVLQTMSGEEFRLEVDETTPVEGLPQLVYEVRGLEEAVAVKIVAIDGSQLPSASAVASLT
mmetsp:Transcript_3587/g.9773  ORF Transcript_3587/g.9773 Transcript_3587/m.9773 type:complete len:295 (-) Transcript_3587:172-1056(-)